MQVLNSVVGQATDADVSERLHALSHAGKVEYLVLERADMARHRLRLQSDKGTEYAIALPRDQRLANGSVLLLEDERAVVVRMAEEQWLELEPVDVTAALDLGYLIGNMHWRARAEGSVMRIALEGEESGYLARLRPLLDSGRVKRVDHA